MAFRQEDFFSCYYPDTVSTVWPFSPVSLGYNRYRAHDAFPHGDHPASHIGTNKNGRMLHTVTLVHVARGCGTFWSDRRPKVQVPANTIMFVHPSIRHFYRFSADFGWDDEWLELKAADAMPLLEASGVTPEDPVRTIPTLAGLARRFQELFDMAYSNPGGNSRLAAASYHVLAEALALWPTRGRATHVTETVDRMCELLSADLLNVRSIAEMSRLCGMSASRLRTLFTQRIGVSPKRYQLQIRMLRAQELLTSSNLTVAEIAKATGFSSIDAFSRQFHRTTGRTPLALRNRSS